jgi:hypothetical protein
MKSGALVDLIQVGVPKGKQLARAGVVVAVAALLTGATSDNSGYPTGFRNWEHLHSGVILEGSPAYQGFGGLHETYGNAVAMRGYPKGQYSNGAMFVFDVHNVAIAKGSIEPTKRRQVDVMIKTAGAWKFYEFKGDSHTERSITVAQGEAQCAACHNGAPKDHVFRTDDQAPSMP